ncbi:hypothetical protein ABMA28_003481 [Loxostege sticticalis]|uniref:HAT C-terminal dimerisation domain-containing protein n=1 Tax=Loxostege sticticalis TaxID=481309 RepID=A0ABD0SW91_LOXSC
MSDTEGEGPSTPKKTRKGKHIKQKYRQQWESEEFFKDWIAPVDDDPYRAKCTKCDVKLSCELSTLRRHVTNNTHKKKTMAASSTKTLSSYFKSREKDQDCLVVEAEIKLAGFVAEHNISFLAMDHLSDLLKSCFPDSKIAADLAMKRDKCTATVKNVIGESQKEYLENILRHQKFSVLADESTDIASCKTICIVVRYFDKNYKKIMTCLWQLEPLHEKTGTGETSSSRGCTAESLYLTIIETFTQRKVPLENIIGFASDGCNVMMGAHNSVASRLRTALPGIQIIKCICHSMHLCANEACKELPRRCEDLARNVYAFFKHSAKRQAEFVEFQIFMNAKVHKLLHPSQTRWLSLLSVVNRLLEQWDSLKLFFAQKWLEERTVAAELIFRELHDDFVKLYILFLQWILPKFVKLNEYFQGSEARLIELDDNMKILYKEILQCYMSRDYVNQTEICSIDPENSQHFLPQMYMGVKILTETEKPNITNQKDLLNEFNTRCRKFLITSCNEIRKRYDFSDKILPFLKYLSPEEAVRQSARETFPSLLPLTKQLPRIVSELEMQRIDDEWRLLPNINKFTGLEIGKWKVHEFWANVHDETDCKALANFALDVLCLPHSNADCERVFSEVNNMKTKSRNKLITSTFNGALLARQAVKNQGGCTKFQASNDMCKKMKSKEKYSLHKKDSEVFESIRNLYGEDITDIM